MYNDYFGFTHAPFGDDGPQPLLFSSAYQSASICLRRSLATLQGPLLLSGISGVGKTTLLRQLIPELESQGHYVLYWCAPVDFQDLFKDLCGALGLVVHGNGLAAALKAWGDGLPVQPVKDGQLVLVLDNAQQLSGETLEELRCLSQLKTKDQWLVWVMLSAQPELEIRLHQEPVLRLLAQDLGGHCRFSALRDEEVAFYVRERLQATGHTGERLFEVEAIDRLIVQSQGVPGRINAICHQALTLAASNSAERVSAPMIRGVEAEARIAEVEVEAPTAPPGPPSYPADLYHKPAMPHRRAPIAQVPPQKTSRRSRALINLVLLIPLTLIGASLVLRYMDLPWDFGPLSQFLKPKSLKTAALEQSAKPGTDEPSAATSTSLAGASAEQVPAVEIPPADAAAAAADTTSGDLPPSVEEALTASEQSLTSFEAALDKFEKTLSALEQQSAAPNEEVTTAADAVPPVAAEITPPSDGIEPVPAKATKTPRLSTGTAIVPATPGEVPAMSAKAPVSPSADDGTSEQRIRRLLDDAGQWMESRRYTQPPGANALDNYRKVLRLDPGNSEAMQGIERIKANFLNWADSAQQQGNWSNVQLHLEAALIIDPKDAELRLRLDRIRQEQANKRPTNIE